MYKVSWGLSLEMAQSLFYHILLAKASREARLDVRGGGMNGRHFLMAGAGVILQRVWMQTEVENKTIFCNPSTLVITHWNEGLN